MIRYVWLHQTYPSVIWNSVYITTQILNIQISVSLNLNGSNSGIHYVFVESYSIPTRVKQWHAKCKANKTNKPFARKLITNNRKSSNFVSFFLRGKSSQCWALWVCGGFKRLMGDIGVRLDNFEVLWYFVAL